MIAFKILFIICLLIPVAFFMRYLLKKISAETPKQTYTQEEIYDYRRIKRKKKHKAEGDKTARAQRIQASESRTDNRSASENRANNRSASEKRADNRPASEDATTAGRSKKKASPKKEKSGSGYTPRKPAEWHRSERVPFGEVDELKPRRDKIAHNTDQSQENIRSHEDTKASDLPLKTKDKKPRKKRSDKSPSKRQLRKNRERARKRDLNKRKKEGRQ